MTLCGRAQTLAENVWILGCDIQPVRLVMEADHRCSGAVFQAIADLCVFALNIGEIMRRSIYVNGRVAVGIPEIGSGLAGFNELLRLVRQTQVVLVEEIEPFPF